MSEISIYDIVPTPKLADKLIGTSVGGVIPDVTYNFTLEELLQLFIPNIPANTLQGVLDYGNTATQNINLTGTISTTNLTVLATANILNSNLSGNTRVMAGLFDRTNASGTAGQVLRSTGTQVEWYTVPTVIPTLQQVLTSGNTSNISIVLTANLTAVTATADTVVSNTSLNVNGVLRDGIAAVGASNQILSSTGSGVRWVDMPVYNVISPLLYDTPTKTFSIQVANSSQGGYLSSADWINFDGKQNQILLTTTGNNGSSTFVGSTLNIPTYTLSGLGGVPTSRTLTINGVTYDLSANRTWTIAAGVASVTASVPLFSSGGADPNITIQVANTSQSGYLTNTDWNTFNAKQGALTLTTTGTSGPSTLVGTTLNIPQYQSVLTNPITGSGTLNYVSKFTSASSIGDSNIQDSGTLITLGSDTYISSGALGIGTSSLTGRNLLVSANITGATLSVGVTSNGAVQSDVTNARAFSTGVLVADSSTILGLYHYNATQGAIGAGATVDTQYGFYASNNLIGATTNIGYYGFIPSGTGRWNFYAAGTASNYFAGSLGIGTLNLTGYNLRVSKNITGATTAYGVVSDGIVQSDVTTSARGFSTLLGTNASSFFLSGLVHYQAQQGTIGAGSTVSNQYGFAATNSLSGASNNFGFYGDLPSGAGLWNLYMNTTALNYLAGNLLIGSTTDNGLKLQVTGQGYFSSSVGIGTTNLTGYGLRVSKNITGATSAYGIFQNGTVQSDVTTLAIGIWNTLNTAASVFTLPAYTHINISQGTIGAGSVITNQYGIFIDSSLTGATNNYGFYGNITSGTNRWNLYMNGTANNYLAGSLGIGTTSLTGYNLKVLKNITGSTSAYGISSEGAIQSDVTTQTVYFASNASTAAASFTVPIIAHFSAVQGTFGAGSSVTTQYGYFVSSSMTGATNNHAFRGGLTSGTGRWNIYMDGDAENYILGNVGIGVSASRVSSGPILTSTLTNGGSGYVDGTYTDVAVTAISSNGAGALYTIVVSGGVVTTATLTWAGTSYKVGNTITVSNTLLGGTGSGLIITIDTVDSSPLKVSSTIGGDITLYRSDTSLSAGENYGTIKWEGNDATVKASGLQAEIGAFAAGTSGGANLSFFTRSSVAGTSLVENLRITDLGNIGIGVTSGLTQYNVRASKNITGATIAYGITSDGIIQSGVTSQSHYYSTNAQTQATTFTLNSLFHYRAIQGTLGAGSTINNQFGFYVDNTLTGATNNYGFRGEIASGTNRWNLYMAGTAQNYLAGALSIGVTTANASALLQVDSTTKGFLPPRMTAAQRTAIATPAEGLVVFQTDGTVGLYLYASAAWHSMTML